MSDSQWDYVFVYIMLKGMLAEGRVVEAVVKMICVMSFLKIFSRLLLILL